uniref:Uncharacterized protein n=1 Tax=Thaumatella adunca TaxID=2006976 RepID=A0A1Z1MNC7_9FLOR|nr:hypothetical protein [Thaumatella adunca]ARW67342.1 hypothetical protein [Thaumatella adunca]
MNSNLFLFRLYVLVFFFFLFIFSFFLTKQVYILLKNYLQLVKFSKIFIKNLFLDEDIYIKFFNIYINRGNLFLSISMSELFLKIDLFRKDLVYRCLGYCYEESNFLYIAKYYYTKALFFSPSDTKILFRLASTYDKLGDINNATQFFNQVIILDSSYLIPKKYRI